mmetsp:Transcript_6505/g.11035  ORF Transcript_6505/g.11035 Transcript_6505/m.11035 type:complete len:116 (-) Transcript_6505:55-402(-)
MSPLPRLSNDNNGYLSNGNRNSGVKVLSQLQPLKLRQNQVNFIRSEEQDSDLGLNKGSIESDANKENGERKRHTRQLDKDYINQIIMVPSQAISLKSNSVRRQISFQSSSNISLG